MSIAAMSSCWGPGFPARGAEGLDPASVRVVALAIADVVNDLNGNEFYGSLSRLAEKADVHRDTTKRAVAYLVEVGVLALVEERPGRTTRYRWVWQASTDELSTPRGQTAGSKLSTPRGQAATTPRSDRGVPRGLGRDDPKRDTNSSSTGASVEQAQPSSTRPEDEIDRIISGAATARTRRAIDTGRIQNEDAYREKVRAGLDTPDQRAGIAAMLDRFPGAPLDAYVAAFDGGVTANLRYYLRADVDAALYAEQDAAAAGGNRDVHDEPARLTLVSTGREPAQG